VRDVGASGLAFVVASRVVLSVRAGEGGGLILAALTKSAPTLPSPPRHPVTARCAACGVGDRGGRLIFTDAAVVHAPAPKPLRLHSRRLAKPQPGSRLYSRPVQRLEAGCQCHVRPGSPGQGVSRPTISARSVRRTAHPLAGRRVQSRHATPSRQPACQKSCPKHRPRRGQNENCWLGACLVSARCLMCRARRFTLQ
jgi:hypothetical protein